MYSLRSELWTSDIRFLIEPLRTMKCCLRNGLHSSKQWFQSIHEVTKLWFVCMRNLNGKFIDFCKQIKWLRWKKKVKCNGKHHSRWTWMNGVCGRMMMKTRQFNYKVLFILINLKLCYFVVIFSFILNQFFNGNFSKHLPVPKLQHSSQLFRCNQITFRVQSSSSHKSEIEFSNYN